MSGECCPLCGSADTALLHKGGKGSGYRDFVRCAACDMVFAPRCQQLDAAAQKARYLQHNNDVNDPDYRRFLGRLYYALKPYLKHGARGLDYGAGPGPALQRMMLEDGFEAAIYDLYFHPNAAALAQTYDFITCTETAEHFADPMGEFAALNGLLRRGGRLGVMTGMPESWDDFASWHYHRDPTHINFYSRATMEWIAKRHGWDADFPCRNVALFHKRGA